MTELGDTYRRRAGAFAALIDGVPAAQWSSPSPCKGWLARDVVAHVVDYSALVLREKAGLTDVAVSDFAATRSMVQRLLDDPDTPRKVAGHLHWSLSFDLPQHGWDLAVSTGQDATIDPAEVELLWGALNGDPTNWDWQRANGWYAAPVAVPERAPLQDRVLGLLGRDPGWRPPDIHS